MTDYTQEQLDAAIAKAVEEATGGLKAKVTELMDEKKSEQRRREELEREKAEADRMHAEKNGEFQKLYDSERAAREQERAQNEAYRKAIAQRDTNAAASSIGGELTRDTARAALLAEQAQKYVRNGDDGISYEIGGAKVDKPAVMAHLIAQFPFLVDGNQANGGGASGDRDGGAGKKKLSEMTEAERVKLHRENPAEFARLRAAG